MAARDRGLVGRVTGFIAAGPERGYTGGSMRRTRSRFGRRSFLQGGLALAGIGVAAGCGQASPPWQRPAKVPRVGILPLTTPASGASLLDAFRGGLRDLGYVEGQTIILEPRFSEGQVERYPELVAELVRLDVSVIVVQDSTAVRVARQAGGTIPIVFACGSEVPVERGLVASLARPGGTVTGVSCGTPELPAKRLQLLRDAVPDLARVAFIGGEPEPVEANPKVGGVAAAARALGLGFELVGLRTPPDFAPRDLEEVFAELARKQVGAFVMDSSAMAANNRLQLSELAIRHRLPSIWGSSQYRDVAFLVYGANNPDAWRHSAAHIDKLLKGASPAELPVELPTAFDFIVNLKIARALGLTIPESVLQQATEVIQ
jgi:putative tryptophan/tyrosine transport system substrate-binding protein